jgi:hypothetical protein
VFIYAEIISSGYFSKKEYKVGHKLYTNSNLMRPPKRPKHRSKSNINMIFREIDYEGLKVDEDKISVLCK